METDEIQIRASLSQALEANALLIAENRRLREALQLIFFELRTADDASFVTLPRQIVQAARALAKHGSQS